MLEKIPDEAAEFGIHETVSQQRSKQRQVQGAAQ